MAKKFDNNSSCLPIEYWTSRATNPYIDADARRACLQILCERVNCELEGAQIAVSILSHKVVSPDQDEALFSLQVIDELVRNCGDKVHKRVGTFRFLNQLVKLITPKYLGNQTSPEVKNITIRLLYIWQRQLGDVEKFKEVYNNLKQNKVIINDPGVDEDSTFVMQGWLDNEQPGNAVIATTSSRRADFETEETIARLKKLVKEDNVEAANLYIQTLLKEKEDKEKQECEKVRNLQKAEKICQELQRHFIEKTTEAIGFAPVDNSEGRMEKIEKLFEQLYALRSNIQLYVQEAAERNDEGLGNMIAINERVNMWIKKSYDKSNAEQMRKGDGGSNEECADLLGTTLPEEERYSTPPDSNSMIDKIAQEDIPKLPSPLSFQLSEGVDVPFIGFNRIMTPQMSRRTVKSTIVADVNSPIKELTELENLFDTSPPTTFHGNKPTLNQLSKVPPSEKINKLDGIMLSSRDPIVFIDKMNIRVLLYRTVHEVNPTVETFVFAVTNSGTQTLEDVQVCVKSNTQVCQLRIEPVTRFVLPGVSIINGCPSKFLLLHCIQYQESREVDMNVSVSFKLQFERTITSNLTVSLI